MMIRRMTLADLPQVAQIEGRIFSRPWSADAFASAVHDQNALFLVAVCDLPDTADGMDGSNPQTVAGYIGMYLSVPEGEITNVAVSEPFRGRGFGGRLVREIQEEALSLGVNQIFLEVRDSNETAIHVYAAAGFEEIGKRRGFYELPREDARIMRWQTETG